MIDFGGGYREKFIPEPGIKEVNLGLGTSAIVLSLFAGGHVGIGMAIVAGVITYVNNIRLNK